MSGAWSRVIDLGGIAAVNALLAATACAAVWCVARAGGRPALVHALWLVVLVRLLVPPVVALPVVPPIDPVSWVAATELDDPTSLPTGAVLGESAGRSSVVAGAAVRSGGRTGTPLASSLLVIAWLLGSALIAVGAIRRRRTMARVLQLAEPADASIRTLAADLACDLGLPESPPILVVPARVSPMLWCAPRGLCIVLPAGLLRRLPGGGLEAVLAHELAHVRRRDHWTRRLELVATLLCWWAPALWWARAGLRRAEERCCDLWVLRVRPRLATSYARTLVETAAFVNNSSRPNGTPGRLPALASGAGPVRYLKERVTMIMRPDRSTGPTTSISQRIALAAVAIVALAVAPAAIESTAGEPGGRDALSREVLASEASRLEDEVAALHRQIAELAAKREALARELERLASRRPDHVAPREIERAIQRELLDRERGRIREDRERLRAELLQLRARERVEARAPRDSRDGSRELARALALDAREQARAARERVTENRRMRDALRGELRELHRSAERVRDPETRAVIDRQAKELRSLMRELGADAGDAEKRLDRSRRAELEELILEAEAAGELDEAKRLRRRLEQDTER